MRIFIALVALSLAACVARLDDDTAAPDAQATLTADAAPSSPDAACPVEPAPPQESLILGTWGMAVDASACSLGSLSLTVTLRHALAGPPTPVSVSVLGHTLASGGVRVDRAPVASQDTTRATVAAVLDDGSEMLLILDDDGPDHTALVTWTIDGCIVAGNAMITERTP